MAVRTDLTELFGVDERFLDGLSDLTDRFFEAADVRVGNVRRAIDLHRLCAGVGFGIEDLFDAERVVDGDAVTGLKAVTDGRRDFRQHFLIVAVLFDDDAVVGRSSAVAMYSDEV